VQIVILFIRSQISVATKLKNRTGQNPEKVCNYFESNIACKNLAGVVLTRNRDLALAGFFFKSTDHLLILE